MKLAGVTIERAARPRHRFAQALAAFLDLTPATFQDAHPRLRRRAIEERQVYSEAVVGVVVRAGSVSWETRRARRTGVPAGAAFSAINPSACMRRSAGYSDP